MEPLVRAVNDRLGRTGDRPFDMEEAVQALIGMGERNEIM